MKKLNACVFLGLLGLFTNSVALGAIQPIQGRIPAIVWNAHSSTVEQDAATSLPQRWDASSPAAAPALEREEVRGTSGLGDYMQYWVYIAQEMQEDFNNLAAHGILPEGVETWAVEELRKDAHYKSLTTAFLKAKRRYEFGYKINFRIARAFQSLGRVRMCNQKIKANQDFLAHLKGMAAKCEETLAAYQSSKLEEIYAQTPIHSVELYHMQGFKSDPVMKKRRLKDHIHRALDDAGLADWPRILLKHDPVYREHAEPFEQDAEYRDLSDEAYDAGERAYLALVKADEVRLKYGDRLSSTQRTANEEYVARLREEHWAAQKKLYLRGTQIWEAMKARQPAPVRHSLEFDYMPEFVYTIEQWEADVIEYKRLGHLQVKDLLTQPTYRACLYDLFKSTQRLRFGLAKAFELERQFAGEITAQQLQLNNEYTMSLRVSLDHSRLELEACRQRLLEKEAQKEAQERNRPPGEGRISIGVGTKPIGKTKP